MYTKYNQNLNFIDKSKVFYLWGYLFLLFEGWSFRFFPSIAGDELLVVQYAYIAFGFFHWQKNKHSLLTKQNLYYFWWIVAGIALSMIPANLYHNQSFSISITAYRAQYLWFFLPVLLRIAPSEQEIIKVCNIVLVFMWGVYLSRHFFPEFLIIQENMDLTAMKGKLDMGYVPGMTLAIFPLYYYFSKFKETFDKRHLIGLISAFAFLIVMSNRSNLFAVIIAIGAVYLFNKSRDKSFIILFVVAFSVLAYATTASYWDELFAETIDQINDVDYNRNKAFTYFFYQANEHWLTNILGNGFLSFRASNTMANLMEDGIYNSDMGFLGFWNQFGIIPIVAFIMIPFYAIKDYKIPLYLKLLGLHIWLCSYSTSYYGAAGHAIIFIFVYYLLVYHRNMNGENIFSLKNLRCKQ